MLDPLGGRQLNRKEEMLRKLYMTTPHRSGAFSPGGSADRALNQFVSGLNPMNTLAVWQAMPRTGMSDQSNRLQPPAEQTTAALTEPFRHPGENMGTLAALVLGLAFSKGLPGGASKGAPFSEFTAHEMLYGPRQARMVQHRRPVSKGENLLMRRRQLAAEQIAYRKYQDFQSKDAAFAGGDVYGEPMWLLSGSRIASPTSLSTSLVRELFPLARTLADSRYAWHNELHRPAMARNNVNVPVSREMYNLYNVGKLFQEHMPAGAISKDMQAELLAAYMRTLPKR